MDKMMTEKEWELFKNYIRVMQIRMSELFLSFTNSNFDECLTYLDKIDADTSACKTEIREIKGW